MPAAQGREREGWHPVPVIPTARLRVGHQGQSAPCNLSLMLRANASNDGGVGSVVLGFAVPPVLFS